MAVKLSMNATIVVGIFVINVWETENARDARVTFATFA
jgi:hypothetical protein